MSKKSGFTLVELMIIVAILADILLIALPAFIRARNTAQNTRLINDFRTAASAFEMYAAENYRYPAEVAQGVIPAGMGVYLNGMAFNARTPIGGQWDWTYTASPQAAEVCVIVAGIDDVRMTTIDRQIDNGVLTTGHFRKRDATRYAYIIE